MVGLADVSCRDLLTCLQRSPRQVDNARAASNSGRWHLSGLTNARTAWGVQCGLKLECWSEVAPCRGVLVCKNVLVKWAKV